MYAKLNFQQMLLLFYYNSVKLGSKNMCIQGNWEFYWILLEENYFWGPKYWLYFHCLGNYVDICLFHMCNAIKASKIYGENASAEENAEISIC